MGNVVLGMTMSMDGYVNEQIGKTKVLDFPIRTQLRFRVIR
jgi:hypothetical protein